MKSPKVFAGSKGFLRNFWDFTGAAVALLLSLVGFYNAHGSADPSSPSALHGASYVINLKDGSEIVCKLAMAELGFKSSLVGKVTVSLRDISTISFANETSPGVLTTTNGNVLNVQFDSDYLPVETSFGHIRIPINVIRKMGSVPESTGLSATGFVPKYDYAGHWSDGSNVHREGRHISSTQITPNYAHSFAGDYVNDTTIVGSQERKNLSDGTITRMQVTITLLSPNEASTCWKALDSSSDLRQGQTGGDTIKRVSLE